MTRTSPETASWSVRAATWLSGAQFFVFGIAIGVMTVVWAEVITALDLGEGLFGTAHLLLPVVGLVTLLSARRLYLVFDHRALGIGGQVALFGMFVALGTSPNLWGLLVAFALAGLGSALVDTATNSVFMDIYNRSGRDVMNVMYAVNSGGTVISALGAGALLSIGVDYRVVVAIAAALSLPVIAASFVVAYPPVQRGGGDGADDEPHGLDMRRLLRVRLFRVVFLLTVLAIAVESIVQVWSVIYIDRLLDVPIIVGGAAFALFSLLMMLGRLANAWMVSRWGVRNSLLLSAAGTTVAGLLLVSGGGTVATVVAFVLTGIAIAGVQPTSLSAASTIAPSQVSVVAAAMMIPAYAAFVSAPTAYGWLAQATSLDTAMVIVLLCGIGIGLLGLDRSVREVDRRRSASDSVDESEVADLSSSGGRRETDRSGSATDDSLQQ